MRNDPTHTISYNPLPDRATAFRNRKDGANQIRPATATLLLLTSLIVSCSEPRSNNDAEKTTPSAQTIAIQTIRWSDADSGYVDKQPFRLSNVDAPESQRPSIKKSSAKCEEEYLLGTQATQLMRKLYDTDLSYKLAGDRDRYGRMVIELYKGEVHVQTDATERGILKPWPHDNGTALVSKPDWCSEKTPS